MDEIPSDLQAALRPFIDAILTSKSEAGPSPKIQQLCEMVDKLPDEHKSTLMPVVRTISENAVYRRRIQGLIQDALAQLRLEIKYLVFDLEATRRELDKARNDLNRGNSDHD